MNVLLMIFDFFIVIFSLLVATFLRFDFDLPSNFLQQKSMFFLAYSLLMVSTFAAFGEYEEKWEYSSLKEYTKTILTFLSVNLFIGLFFYFSQGFFVPRSIFLISLPLSILFIVASRVFYRGLREYSIDQDNGLKVAVVCKEENLSKIFDEVKFFNVAAIFLVTNKRIVGRTFRGIPVFYDISFLKKIPVNEVFVDKEIGEELYLKVVENKHYNSIIRKVDLKPYLLIENFRIEDVISREKREINVEVDKDKIFLITGAGGSIGKYIAKELINLGVKKIKFLDYSEENLHNLRLELLPFQDCQKEFILFDIKDENIHKVVGEVDVIFHCAANKHVPIVEENKYTAYLTNVVGLLNTIEALKRKDREFVFISTDKAVKPVNFMGLTKRMGELITLSYKDDYRKSIVVRFGNVFGTSGSLIPTVIKQINMYNKVFLTSPDVKRFFMMPDEAAKLIISSLQIDNGNIAVLDMGEQIKIIEIIQKIIQVVAHTRKIDIEIIGLRKGEKIEEELFFDFEKIIDKKDYVFVVHPNVEISKNEIIDFIRKLMENLKSTKDLDNFIENELKDFVLSIKKV